MLGFFTPPNEHAVIPLAVLQSIRLILGFRPRVILGVGGYASGPVLFAAKLLGVRIILFEPNAYPGLTNRWLAPFVDKAFVNFDVTRSFFNEADSVGIPIRSGLVQKTKAHSRPLRILIFGGSQGARGINKTVIEAVKRNGRWLNDVEIVHQTGMHDFHSLDVEYQKVARENIKCLEFLYDMPERYAWADLVICRAGASTLAELAACQKAAVLIPFPHAADNHQQKNAEALVAKNAAVMVVQKDFTPEKLESLVESFLTHPNQLTQLETSISTFYKAQSAEKIAEELARN
jgi:UDP-N-acetylglucosamine--N-acetylmuramyl-(pentapeptide) pyrophosphoryl-undecaprenol N-acetylglucosamine transferase